MKQVYSAIFTKCKNEYIVDVPDFDISTVGKDLADAIDMARDAIELMGITWEDDGKQIPAPSDLCEITLKEWQFCTLIDCDFAEYRKALNNRAVKKNCTIPSWLNKKVEQAHINFSATLQEALIQKLGE